MISFFFLPILQTYVQYRIKTNVQKIILYTQIPLYEVQVKLWVLLPYITVEQTGIIKENKWSRKNNLITESHGFSQKDVCGFLFE